MKGGIKFNVARFHKAVLGVLVGYKPLPFVLLSVVSLRREDLSKE